MILTFELQLFHNGTFILILLAIFWLNAVSIISIKFARKFLVEWKLSNINVSYPRPILLFPPWLLWIIIKIKI